MFDYNVYKKEHEPMKILVVAGHPADMFDHCGGTLLHHLQQGDSVTCVSITQGLRIHDEVIYDLVRDGAAAKMTDEEIAALRQERQKVKYAEVLEACGLFGIEDCRFLDYDDEILLVTPEMVSKLAQTIREVHPDLIITHWPYQDNMFSNHHAITGQLTLAAIDAAGRVNFTTKTAAARVAQVAYMLCPTDTYACGATSTFNTARVDYFVDVSDVVDLKVKAISMMRSQKYDTKGYAKKTTEQWNANFGARISCAYAEGFSLARAEMGWTIPVSPYRRWLSQTDEHEILARRGDLSGLNTEVQERE